MEAREHLTQGPTLVLELPEGSEVPEPNLNDCNPFCPLPQKRWAYWDLKVWRSSFSATL